MTDTTKRLQEIAQRYISGPVSVSVGHFADGRQLGEAEHELTGWVIRLDRRVFDSHSHLLGKVFFHEVGHIRSGHIARAWNEAPEKAPTVAHHRRIEDQADSWGDVALRAFEAANGPFYEYITRGSTS